MGKKANLATLAQTEAVTDLSLTLMSLASQTVANNNNNNNNIHKDNSNNIYTQ